MGNFVSSSTISNVDYSKGTKNETIIKNGIVTNRYYKHDQFGNWILINEETTKNSDMFQGITASVNGNVVMDNNGMRVGNIVMDHNGMRIGNLKMDHTGISFTNQDSEPKVVDSKNFNELYESAKTLNNDNEKIDLVNGYQKNVSCIPLNNVFKLSTLFQSDASKVKLYESVIKCIVRRK